MLWQQMIQLLLWFDLRQAKLGVSKATQNPTDDGKAVSVEVWDMHLGFKVLSLLGRVSEPSTWDQQSWVQSHL